MHTEFTYQFKAPPQVVWKYLHNPDVLKRTLPSCRKFEETDIRHYAVELGFDVWPIKDTFTGTVDLLDLNEPTSYRLLMHGVGKPGTLHADTHIQLVKTQTGTEVRCDSEVEVTGLMAKAGQRVMGGVMRIILGRFFKNVAAEIQQ